MMKKIFSFMIIFFLISIISVFAVTEYPQIGGDNGFFLQGNGFFNEGMNSEIITGTRTLQMPEAAPLVVDLDGDGTREIIVVNDMEIQIFRNITLDPVTSFFASTIMNNINVIAYDYDGDSKKELLIYGRGLLAQLQVLDFNGTALTNILNVSMPVGYKTGQVTVACRDVDECAMVTARNRNVDPVNDLKVIAFDSLGGTTETTLITTNQLLCFPRIPHLEVKDFDADGVDEYILSFVSKTTVTIAIARLLFIDAPVGSGATTDLAHNFGNVATSGNSAETCESSNFDLKISPALSTNLDGLPGLETAVAHMVNSEDLKIKIIKQNGNAYADFPDVFNSDGKLVSNLILADVFEDTGANDLCIMGYQTEQNFINLLCGNTDHSAGIFGTTDNEQFVFEIPDGGYNLSDIFNPSIPHSINTNIIHASNMKISDNQDEIVNTYGVFDLIFDDTLGTIEIINSLDLIFTSPKFEAVVLPIDYEDIGRADLLILTSSNLFYLDDGFRNQPARITEYSINPCVDSTWQINTTVSINIKVEDPELDTVQARGQIYFGGTNLQDSDWSQNGTSGSEFNFGFIANETIGSGSIKLSGRDSLNNPFIPDNIFRTFSVGTNGVSFGDCVTTVLIDLEAEEDDLASDGTDLNNNSISAGLDSFGEFTGLGRTVMWLLVMITITGAILFSNNSNTAKILGMIFMNFFMIVMGTFLEYFDFGLMLTLVVVSIATVVIFAWKSFISDSSRVG